MKKAFGLVASLFLALPLVVGASDVCGEEFVYTKTNDFTDSRVEIDFETAFGQSRNQIDVQPQSGYTILKVELDVDGDGHVGYHTYTLSSVSDYNPNPGTAINGARVTVKKNDCEVPPPVDVCSNIEGNQSTVPSGYTESGGICTEIPEPVDVCPNIDGLQETIPSGKEIIGGQCVDIVPPVEPPACSETQHLEENVCVDNEVVPPPSPEPTPSPAPSQSDSNSRPGGSSIERKVCNVMGLCIQNPSPELRGLLSQLYFLWLKLQSV